MWHRALVAGGNREYRAFGMLFSSHSQVIWMQTAGGRIPFSTFPTLISLCESVGGELLLIHAGVLVTFFNGLIGDYLSFFFTMSLVTCNFPLFSRILGLHNIIGKFEQKIAANTIATTTNIAVAVHFEGISSVVKC